MRTKLVIVIFLLTAYYQSFSCPELKTAKQFIYSGQLIEAEDILTRLSCKSTDKRIEINALLTICYSGLKMNELATATFQKNQAYAEISDNPWVPIASFAYYSSRNQGCDLGVDLMEKSGELIASADLDIMRYCLLLFTEALITEQSDFIQAQAFLKSMVDTSSFESSYNELKILKARAFHLNGNIQLTLHQYDKALYSLREAEHLYQELEITSGIYWFWNQVTLATALESINNNTEAEKHYHNAFHTAENLPLYYAAVIENYAGLHLCYVGKREKGLEMMSSAEEIITTYYPDDPFLWHIYFYRSNAFSVTNEYDTAAYYNYKSLEIKRLSPERFALSSASAIHTMISYDVAVENLVLEQSKITLDRIKGLSHGKMDLTIALADNYRETHQFEKAVQSYDNIFDIIKTPEVDNSFDYQAIKCLLLRSRTYYEWFEHSLSLKHFDRAFADLDEAIHRALLSKQRGILSNMLTFETLIRENLDRLLDALTNSQVIPQRYHELAIGNLALIDGLSSLNFGVSNLQNSSFIALPRINLNQFQELMDPEELIIQYFEGVNLYAYSITKSTIMLHKLVDIHDSKQLEKFANWYHAMEFQLNPELSNRKDFQKTFGQAYLSLLYPIVEPLSPQINKLTIIPSGNLHSVPFNILLVNDEGDSYANMSYLIKNYRITHQHSLLHEVYYRENNSPKIKINKLGIYSNSHKNYHSSAIMLGPLSLSKEIDYLKSQFIIDKEANESNDKSEFFEKFEESDVIHIATHSISYEDDPMNSFISLGNAGKITVNDIVNSKISPKMVVLSSCKSGIGDFVGGDGYLSLAKAFSISRCPTTILSQWNVSDKSNASIINGFYAGINQNQTISEAMQTAQLTYLSNQSDPLWQHPYFWAMYQVNGFDRKLIMPSKTD